MIRKGWTVGISSRGVGSLKNENGKNIVQDDFELICWDIVTSPSTPGSWISTNEKDLQPYMEDIRFARTINRIQQAMIQELNKIAIIHLYILGFHDELNNFKLTLNNPSTQGEMLKVEQWKEKVLLYKDFIACCGFIFLPICLKPKEFLFFHFSLISQLRYKLVNPN